MHDGLFLIYGVILATLTDRSNLIRSVGERGGERALE